ncbi:MAG: nucleoside recognition domain-containing protein [Acutalibacteraceae bacterium]|nr:nucleoside recognition domain-containing protein [Oscillospiraceae bacterium]
MMNGIWAAIIALSFVSAILTGNVESLSASVVDGAVKAVELAVKLLSTMALWGGIMKITERSGLSLIISRALSPVMKLLFPSLRDKEDIISVMSMNVTANLLGLGNAATPLGLESMRRLQSVNPDRSAASRDMIFFVVMNSASMRVIPTTVAALRQQHGCKTPFDIVPCCILTSLCSLAAGLSAAYIMMNGKRKGAPEC